MSNYIVEFRYVTSLDISRGVTVPLDTIRKYEKSTLAYDFFLLHRRLDILKKCLLRTVFN